MGVARMGCYCALLGVVKPHGTVGQQSMATIRITNGKCRTNINHISWTTRVLNRVYVVINVTDDTNR